MDDAVRAAATAVPHYDDDQAKIWFQLIRDQYKTHTESGEPDWEDFKNQLGPQAQAYGFHDDTINQFVEYLESDSGASPMEVVAGLADEANEAEMLEAYSYAYTPAAPPAEDAQPDVPGYISDGAGNYYLSDGVTQVWADSSGYFFDAYENWYLDGELYPPSVPAAAEPETADAAPSDVFDEEGLSEAMQALFALDEEDREQVVALADSLPEVDENLGAEVAALAKELELSDEELQEVLDYFTEQNVEELVAQEIDSLK